MSTLLVHKLKLNRQRFHTCLSLIDDRQCTVLPLASVMIQFFYHITKSSNALFGVTSHVTPRMQPFERCERSSLWGVSSTFDVGNVLKHVNLCSDRFV